MLLEVSYPMAITWLQCIFKYIFLGCLFLADYRTVWFLLPPAWEVVLARSAYFSLYKASALLQATAL